MSKGSGRRRISPSDGIQYDEETMMTNIEERGGSHRQSAKRELLLGIRTGAQPTASKDYGSHSGTGENGRYSGVGRKNDFRNWKSYTRGKQYHHKEVIRENREHHRPVPAGLAARLRERSIAVLLHEARRRRESRRRYDRSCANYTSSYTPFRNPPQSEQKYPMGFAVFEERVRRIAFRVKYGYL
jgi:hypothetical protein